MNDDIRPGGKNQAKPARQEPVYTMPEKFMQQTVPASSVHHTKRTVFIVGMVLALASIIAAIVVFFIQQYQTTQITATTNTAIAEEADITGLGEISSTEENDNTNTFENTNGNTASINLDVDPELEKNINDELFGNNTNSLENENTNTVDTNVVDHSDVPDTADKDKDDLTDIEEELYTTKNHLPDSDRDGYVDGVEVRNLYSPIVADEDLIDSGVVIEYDNDVAGWSIFYPSDWLVEPIDKTKQEVLFTSSSVEGEFIQVTVEPNTEGYSAVEWYDALFQEGAEELDEVNISGLDGIVSADGLRYYFANSTQRISIIYNIGLQEEIAFRTTFQMMVNSFIYTAAIDDDVESVDNKKNTADQENDTTNDDDTTI